MKKVYISPIQLQWKMQYEQTILMAKQVKDSSFVKKLDKFLAFPPDSMISEKVLDTLMYQYKRVVTEAWVLSQIEIHMLKGDYVRASEEAFKFFNEDKAKVRRHLEQIILTAIKTGTVTAASDAYAVLSEHYRIFPERTNYVIVEKILTICYREKNSNRAKDFAKRICHGLTPRHVDYFNNFDKKNLFEFIRSFTT